MGRTGRRSCRFSRSQRPLGGHGQQIGTGGDVIGGVGVSSVAEVGRKQRQQRPHVGPILVPDREPLDREPMAEVVGTKPLAAPVETGECRRRAECDVSPAGDSRVPRELMKKPVVSGEGKEASRHLA